MSRLRISAISYLNTAPLMWDFDHGQPPGLDGSGRALEGDLARDFELQYTVPSSCAAALRANAADIGIIPAFAYTSIPGLAILPDAAIASLGAVRSILLVCRKPLDQVRSVALEYRCKKDDPPRRLPLYDHAAATGVAGALSALALNPLPVPLNAPRLRG